MAGDAGTGGLLVRDAADVADELRRWQPISPARGAGRSEILDRSSGVPLGNERCALDEEACWLVAKVERGALPIHLDGCARDGGNRSGEPRLQEADEGGVEPDVG